MSQIRPHGSVHSQITERGDISAINLGYARSKCSGFRLFIPPNHIYESEKTNKVVLG